MTMLVYGGSFNPPTISHDRIIDKLETLNLGDIIISPTVTHAFDKELVPIHVRVSWLYKLYPKYIILPMERYMIDHLQSIRYMYNIHAYELFIVIGSDILKDLPKWKDYDKLINYYKFLIIIRNVDDLKYLTNIKNYAIIDALDDDVSSSKYRSMPTARKYMIPHRIANDVELTYKEKL